MSFFTEWGKSIGREAALSLDYDKIVREAVAAQFELLATKPEYAHVAARLKRMARFTRERTNGDHGQGAETKKPPTT